MKATPENYPSNAFAVGEQMLCPGAAIVPHAHTPTRAAARDPRPRPGDDRRQLRPFDTGSMAWSVGG
jgi:hypothetical protein